MQFYDEKDLAYWKKQAEAGKAVIIEIPVSNMLDLDIRSLAKKPGGSVTADDLEEWIKENKAEIEKALSAEAKEKAAVEKLENKLYDQTDESGGEKDEPAKNDALDDKARTVTQIMAKEAFTEDQMSVIAEAMVEGLPDKYLLCFMKKEYSPAVMKQLKDYCTKMYREEVRRSDEL